MSALRLRINVIRRDIRRLAALAAERAAAADGYRDERFRPLSEAKEIVGVESPGGPGGGRRRD